ncbi:DUF4384 domain-containing protein [Laspinema olomoucense]|uniref:DUF4384 domain-containing protein n=1 Tax=Laspinema olomoucense TaxID=3231600 RepID=UPI0021BAA719|nr:DUF4384 domain-containing protein [Laspinema sp. D3a]MCT7987757.1 DUF4384 domain-containing protein [Laspinema sp. D3a]
MIAITPANSLQERFLNDFVDQVVWQHGSDTQRLCCRLRFHPLNKQKRSSQLAETIHSQLNITFPSTNMPGTLGEVITKIKNRFGDKMAADGIALDLLQRKKGREAHHPDSKAPWEIIYQWLWEIEFPRQGWKLVQEIATYAMEELQMIDPPDRDLRRRVSKNPATIIKLKEYILHVKFQDPGHLLLINQGVSGNLYCFCPSRGYSVNPQVMPDKNLYIPDLQSLIPDPLQYTDIGPEYFLAILTKNPVKLSWVNPDSDPDDIDITPERLNEIFQQVGRQWDTQVFYKKFEVIESPKEPARV